MANEKRLDLIDRKALAARYVELDYNTAGTPWTLRDVLNFLELAPTVDAVEVVHGRWERVIPTKSAAKWSIKVSCSNCHRQGYTHHKYCHHCGAKMDGDGNV